MKVAKKVLTVTAIERAKVPETGFVELRDSSTPGLSFRLYADGRREWRYRYLRLESRGPGIAANKRLRSQASLGYYPDLKLEGARVKALAMRDQLRRGIDPLAVRREEERRSVVENTAAKAQTEQQSVEGVAKEFLKRQQKSKRPKGYAGDVRQVNTLIIPAWRGRPLREVTRGDVIRLLEEVLDSRGGVAANRLQALIHCLFQFAWDKEYVPANPVARLERRFKEVERERVLSSTELRAVWAVSEKTTSLAGFVFRLMLLTAQRGGEVCRLRWQDLEIRADGLWWNLPGRFRKNARDHHVPLGDLACELIETMRPATGRYEWVFTTAEGDEVHPKPLVLESKVIERLRVLSGVSAWTPHDLRRTAATLLGEAEVASHVITLLLGHAQKKLVKTYQRSPRAGELRRAVQTLEREVRAILAGETAEVLPFARSEPEKREGDAGREEA